LLDAKVDSITAFRRHPLSEEIRASATPTPMPSSITRGQTAPTNVRVPGAPGATLTPTLIERNVVEVTFKASPGAVRKVVNEITNSTGQFFIIRDLYVHNEKDKGPPREKTATAAPVESPQPSPGQSPAGGLNFIVGNEHVEVSATIEMLRYTF